MKLRRIRVERVVGDGWTQWIQPVRRGYLLACCDCALVHRMNFRIKNGRVQFKAQRAPVYTRRERKQSYVNSLSSKDFKL